MATISLRAVQNNVNLTGAEISLREAVAAFCTFYEPVTAVSLVKIGELVGMKASQASKAMTELKKHGEIAEHMGRFYLLKLDDRQLQGIADKDFALLKTLAALGCEEAKPIVSKMETLNSISETGIDFLLHYFLFSEFPFWKQSFPNQQLDVSNMETNVVKTETPFKGSKNGDFKENGVIGEAEVGSVSSTENENETRSAAASDGAAADTDNLPVGDIDDLPADIQNSGKNHENKEIWVKSHIRSDIKGLEKWLDHLESLPECENIPVRGLWKKYEKKCKKLARSATRDRFLANWLWDDVVSVPEKISEEEETIENALVQGNNYGKTSKQKRDEYAITEHKLLEQNRKNVERRRAQLLRTGDADDR